MAWDGHKKDKKDIRRQVKSVTRWTCRGVLLRVTLYLLYRGTPSSPSSLPPSKLTIMVLLVTSDSEQFVVEKDVAERSVLIKNMLEGDYFPLYLIPESTQSTTFIQMLAKATSRYRSPMSHRVF